MFAARWVVFLEYLMLMVFERKMGSNQGFGVWPSYSLAVLFSR